MSEETCGGLSEVPGLLLVLRHDTKSRHSQSRLCLLGI